MGLNLCDRCVADCRHERNPNEIVVKCGAFKPPMTNADRIRAMSDEELADMFAEFAEENPSDDANAWYEWLTKPAEERCKELEASQ